ncbi:glycerol-3-phosphate dehydrogenase C-terminal domain-containing protein, partial [Hydrogenophaga sp.]|uniref:glycerol-3-phosphate dehydrogenase C-terminal domain-containing protein n=1 Tax=Hydrogenophaga sp. TaxID=1904254 RepID=UPI00356913E4
MEAEINFILEEASIALGQPVTRADVKSIWVGLRPLVRPPAADATQHTRQVSREHTIVKSAQGLVTVTGGKWTTYRAMAEDVIQRCQEWGSLEPRNVVQPNPTAGADATGTSHHRLAGTPAQTHGGEAASLTAAPGAHLYGSDNTQIQTLPGHDRWLTPGLSEAMVRFAARSEFALTVEDVLARRSRLLFLDAKTAQQVAPRVADILSEETGNNPALPEFLGLSEAYQGAWARA